MMENKYVNQQEPLLSFEFSSSNGEIKPLTFRHPHKVIMAHRLKRFYHAFNAYKKPFLKGFMQPDFYPMKVPLRLILPLK